MQVADILAINQGGDRIGNAGLVQTQPGCLFAIDFDNPSLRLGLGAIVNIHDSSSLLQKFAHIAGNLYLPLVIDTIYLGYQWLLHRRPWRDLDNFDISTIAVTDFL